MQFRYHHQADMPVERIIALRRQAEAAGFQVRLILRIPTSVAEPIRS